MNNALLELLPHRAPMLLLDDAVHVDVNSGTSLIFITRDSTFCIPGKGVPAWVGLEYMGQTAALIGGFQQLHGDLEDHTGFLLGSRKFNTTLPWFAIGTTLRVYCEQSALVGHTLANFTAQIFIHGSTDEMPVATALLSVFRQPTADNSKPGSTP